MVKRVLAVASAALMGTTFAACGGTTSTTTDTGGTAVTLEAADFVFKPAALTLAKGQKYTVTIKNTGTKQHNLTIETGADKKVNTDVDAGKSASVTFTVTADGPVQYHCEYHQAFKDPSNGNLGMVGTINGTGAAPGGATSPSSGSGSYNPYG